MNNIFTTTTMEGTCVYAVHAHDAGRYFAAEGLAFLPATPPTPEQLADEQALYAAYGDGPEDADPAPWGRFRTPAAAERAVRLQDAMHCVAEDVSAWGAPGECCALACEPLQTELEALERQFGVRA